MFSCTPPWTRAIQERSDFPTVSGNCRHPWEGWSEWQDLNLRPPRPERGALPGCATLRLESRSYSGALIPSQAQAVFGYRALIEGFGGTSCEAADGEFGWRKKPCNWRNT